MAVTLGKRKRQKHAEDLDAGSEDEEAMRALFQRAFEAKFKALPQAPPPREGEMDDDDDEDPDETEDSDWSGISEQEDEDVVELHQHDSAPSASSGMQGPERKAFMSSKLPISRPATSVRSTKQHDPIPGEDQAEVTNLKHDLALQRLLKESHLLDPASFTRKEPILDGKNRLDALNLRMKDLGAKKSALEQTKMPLSHRRGITAKAAGREGRRRKEALENGIILERAQHAVKAQKRRDRGVGAPAIGRFRGGTLNIRAKDVKSLQGPTKSRSGRR